MPEFPDIEVYLNALRERIAGRVLLDLRVLNPFVLRTVDPPVAAFEGARVESLRRLGKRIVIGFERELFAVIHLMIAGRLRWLAPGAKTPGKIALARFEFEHGALALTEAGTKRRASLHLVRGEPALAALDPGGADVFELDDAAFAARLTRGNHAVKRALTDPKLFSGIGNAYSDEILHAARLSPFKPAANLDDAELRRLLDATRDTLAAWRDRLDRERAGGFPEKVTAFRTGMAVHGRFGEACPDCGAPVQRIVYAENETNYCARCQTGGKILADRALSRLLHDSWPRNIDELP